MEKDVFELDAFLTQEQMKDMLPSITDHLRKFFLTNDRHNNKTFKHINDRWEATDELNLLKMNEKIKKNYGKQEPQDIWEHDPLNKKGRRMIIEEIKLEAVEELDCF